MEHATRLTLAAGWDLPTLSRQGTAIHTRQFRCAGIAEPEGNSANNEERGVGLNERFNILDFNAGEDARTPILVTQPLAQVQNMATVDGLRTRCILGRSGLVRRLSLTIDRIEKLVSRVVYSLYM